MARGRGGDRESSPGKIRANAAQGARPQVRQPAPVARFQGQEWGTQAQQIAMQQQAPDPAPVAATSSTTSPRRRVPSLDDPTERPMEPVTAGLPIGPGAGPEALGTLTPLDRLRRLYRQNPHPDLLEILLLAEGR